MLYIIPTPIGDLDDISVKAIKTLEKLDILICEDPRMTGKLLKLLKIANKPKLVQYTRNHCYNKVEIESVLQTPDIAIGLVSDGGYPVLSDPGVDVVRTAQEIGLEYTVLTGSNALLPAAIGSGFVSKEFVFLGFPPLKKGRQKWLQNNLLQPQYPVVIYESVHRIRKLIIELKQLLEPDRKVFIIREISKLYEQKYLCRVCELEPESIKEKGEFVIVIDKV
jgi:16S rRNA (cytidine1402-2'-O)-methyltransferase